MARAMTAVLNHYAYFTEIEERFQQRRGTLTMLSTLDWALMDTWHEAGVPLAAVLRGIDDAFDKHDARAAKTGRRLRKVNGLAWAAQAVLLATEQMKEAAVGAAPESPAEPRESGFEDSVVAAYLRGNAERLTVADVPAAAAEGLCAIAERLRALAAGDLNDMETLERALGLLEEKLFAVLLLVTPETEQLHWRQDAASGLAGSRGMSAAQLRQVTQQFLHKRLLQTYNLPRLSLFYMEHR